MIDTFKTHGRSLTSPPEDAGPIVPADAGELTHATRAIYVGAQGDVRAIMLGGATVTLAGVPAGSFLPLRVRQVLASGTTAADIVGFW
jgi:hypothetical protein